jgi:hypothetical protein
MRTVNRDASRPRLQVSLHVALALLLIAAILAVGALLGLYNYRQTSRIVLNASDDVFTRMSREAVLELARTAAPVQSLVDVLAMQSLASAATFDERMRELPALVEALRRNPALTALYAGYTSMQICSSCS